MRAILGKILGELGYQVLQAGNGREGLACLKEHGSVDLVLVDWNMPEMNGIDFLQAVRKEPVYARMRMMMVSTETEAAEISKALGVGADEYVMKPFTRDVLQQKLEMMGMASR